MQHLQKKEHLLKMHLLQLLGGPDLVFSRSTFNDYKIPLPERTNKDKTRDNKIRSINKEEWHPKDHGFPEPEPIKSNQEVPKFYALKEDSPIHDYLRAIDEHFRFNEQQDEPTSEFEVRTDNDLWFNGQLNSITPEFSPEDTYPLEGYIQDNKDAPSSDSQEYVDDSQKYMKETAESSLISDEEDYPPLFMNQYKEHKVFKVDNDKDGITDDPIPEWRLEPATTAPKHIGTAFHTFTLDDFKVSKWR